MYLNEDVNEFIEALTFDDEGRAYLYNEEYDEYNLVEDEDTLDFIDELCERTYRHKDSDLAHVAASGGITGAALGGIHALQKYARAGKAKKTVTKQMGPGWNVTTFKNGVAVGSKPSTYTKQVAKYGKEGLAKVARAGRSTTAKAALGVAGISVAGVINRIEDFSNPGRECYQVIERLFGPSSFI